MEAIRKKATAFIENKKNANNLIDLITCLEVIVAICPDCFDYRSLSMH